jgi:cytochrome c oxidase cbb3-type subunit 3
MTLWRLGALAALGWFGAAVLAAQTQDVQKGRQLFLGMCSRCHGAEGGGGEGPNLSHLNRAHNDEELRVIIRDGIPDRGMPRIRRFTDAEMRQMVAFVYSLGAKGGVAATGHAENGKAVYQKLGCAGCHAISGAGGDFGPELTSIGSRRAADYLRQAIVDPGAALPKGSTIPGRGFSEFLPVHVVLANGQEVNGVRVNEDSFTIQVRDRAGKLYSIRKADTKQVEKQFGKSLMPEYKSRASAPEVEDLVAYLATLGTGEAK